MVKIDSFHYLTAQQF